MMRKLALAAAVAAALGAGGLAHAANNSSATLTADNEFYLYSGDATGSDLQFVGSGTSWPTSYSFGFNVNPGDYLYVLAVDDGQPHSWQGVFSTPAGVLHTDAVSWVGAAVAPTRTVTPALIQGVGAWGPITSVLPATSGPWGNVIGDPAANWIWTSGPNSDDLYVLFRTQGAVDAVPEPSTWASLALGLALAGLLARRRAA